MGAARHLALHRFHYSGVVMPQQERAMSHPVVNILIAIHVPLVRAVSTIYVDRFERAEIAVVMSNAARKYFQRSHVKLMRAAGVIVRPFSPNLPMVCSIWVEVR